MNQESIFLFEMNALLSIYFWEENSIHFNQFWFFWKLDCFCIFQDQDESFYCLKLQYAMIHYFKARDPLFLKETFCPFWAILSSKLILFSLYFNRFNAIIYLFGQCVTIYLWEPRKSKHFHQFLFLIRWNHLNNLEI